MNDNLSNGTPVFCTLPGSHFKCGQIVDKTVNQWGTHYTIRVTLESCEGIVDRFDTTSHVGDADQKSIGWKIATTDEVELSNSYAAHDVN